MKIINPNKIKITINNGNSKAINILDFKLKILLPLNLRADILTKIIKASNKKIIAVISSIVIFTIIRFIYGIQYKYSYMNVLERIKKEAKKLQKVIVFPEGTEKRIIKACKIIEREKICKPLILKEGSLEERLEKAVNLLNNNQADGIITGSTHSTALTARLAFKVKRV